MNDKNTLDIQDLYRLARQKSVEGRTALAATVSDFFAAESQLLTARERALMFDILHRIIRDVEMSVRKKVAHYVAKSTEALEWAPWGGQGRTEELTGEPGF